MTERRPALVERLALLSLCAYLVLDFTRAHELLPALGRLRPMLVLGAIAVPAGVWSQKDELRRLWPPLRPAVALFGVFALASVFAIDRSATGAELFQLAKILVMAALVVLLFDSARRLTTAIWLIALSLVSLAASSIVSAYRSGLMSTFSYEALSHRSMDNNDVGRLLAMALPLWWVLWCLGGAWQRTIATAGLAATTLGIVSTFSRGGFVTAVSVVALLCVVSLRGQRLGSLLAAALLAVALQIPEPYADRVESVAEAFESAARTLTAPDADLPSAHGRLEIWQVGMRMFRQRPVIGGGIGTFMTQYGRLEPERPARTSHNIYVELLAEGGLVGFAAWAWLYAGALLGVARIWWHDRSQPAPSVSGTLATGLGASVVAFLVSSTLLSNAFLAQPLMVLAMALAVDRVRRRGPGAAACDP